MPEVAPDATLVPVTEAAEILGVSVRTVERLQAEGELAPVYIPTTGRAKLRRFRRTDLDARVRATQVPA